jgi:hypothetical protein
MCTIGTYRFFLSWFSKEKRVVPLSDALRHMILPARAQWPKSYLNAIHRSALKQTITLSLDDVVADIRNNVIQFRDPSVHLKELILKGRVSLTDGIFAELVARNSLIASFMLWRSHNLHLWPDMKVVALSFLPSQPEAFESSSQIPMCLYHLGISSPLSHPCSSHNSSQTMNLAPYEV